MLKTVLLLPDGREISSGEGTACAVKAATFTQSVNEGTELTLGSVCAGMLEVELLDPGGSLRLQAGQEVWAFREREGIRYPMGCYILEKPARPSPNALTVTAYDRVSLLDRDLTQWLAALTDWPYSLYDFSVMVCSACGLTLKTGAIPNGDFAVQAFTAQGITGRQLIRWAAAAAGCFCRADTDGQLEFAWYTPAAWHGVAIPQPFTADSSGSALTLQGIPGDGFQGALTLWGVTATAEGQTLTLEAGKTLTCYMGGISYDDYTVCPVEKVQLRQTPRDVGTVWPDVAEAANTYILSGNYLLTTEVAQRLEPVAQTLYERLRQVRYTPCSLTMEADPHTRPGQIIAVTDRNGARFIAYIMTKLQKGQTDILECTGSYRRDSVSAVNEVSYKALTGKVLELQTDVEGLRAENRNAAGDMAHLQMDLQGISTQVAHQRSVAEGMATQLTAVEQTAQGLTVQISSMLENGVSGVVTSKKKYSLTDGGLDISSEGDEIGNRIDHTGMCVSRGSVPVLKATAEGVEAVDITVRNYLVVGSHARLEDYSDGLDTGRTACFYL